jgi:hypothetical protein
VDDPVAELDRAIAAARSSYRLSDPLSGGYLAALLYARFHFLDTFRATSLMDAAMEAFVTHACDAVKPTDSLGVPLPQTSPEASRTSFLNEAAALLGPVLAEQAHRADSAALLAQVLHSLHLETGDVTPLRRAVQVCEQALAAQTPDPEVLHTLGSVLVALDPFDGDPERLVHALWCANQAAESPSLPGARKTAYLCGLSAAAQALFGRTRNPDLLELAIHAAASAGELAGDVELLTAEAAHALGTALLRTYETNTDLSYLENAVTCLRTATDTEPLPEYTSTLANALLLMYYDNSDDRLLADAGDQAHRSLTLAAPNDPNRHEYLRRWALSTYLGFMVRGDDSALDIAAAFQRLAIGCMPPAHPQLADAIGLLADIWLAKHDRTKSVADLEGALEAATRARRLSQPDNPDHPQHLARFARAMAICYEETGRVTYLKQAIVTTKEALDGDGLPGHVRGPLLMQLGAFMTQYADHTIDDALLAARNIFRQCAEITDQAPSLRAQAGLTWANMAITAGNWAEAGLACIATLMAVRGMTGLEASRDSQEGKLAGFGGLPSAAAACLLQDDDPRGALTILELGRGVLLAQDMDLRADIRALRCDAPELGERLAALLQDLSNASATLHDIVVSDRPTREEWQVSDRRRRAARSIDAMIHEAREVPGHETFLQAPTPEELIGAAASGPIAVINVSPYRSDALVVQPSGVTVVPLPALTPEAIERISGSILPAADRPYDPGSHEVILDELEWLWENLAEPVLDIAAPAQTDGSTPRLWWCPTGPLSFLPLHAAGRHRSNPSQTVLGRVISSYTPTIRALRHARARSAAPDAKPDLLAVAVSRTPHSPHGLPSALREANLVAEMNMGTIILADAEATVDAVRAALPGFRRAHFACHGLADTTSPSRSSLLLHDADDILTAGDISRLDLTSAELAYLSVCDTARPDYANTDEALHIAGAFLLAGYPSVIGALWQVPDRIGLRLARGFYRHLGEVSDPAHALHNTVMDLYKVTPDKPGLWANLVHFGA